MPRSDKEKRKQYNRDYHRRRYLLDPEFRERRQRQAREYAAKVKREKEKAKIITGKRKKL